MNEEKNVHLTLNNELCSL